MEKRILTDEMLEGFAAHMTEERSENTRQYYLRVLRELADYAGTEPVTKQTVIVFKEKLTEGYMPGTVNRIPEVRFSDFWKSSGKRGAAEGGCA